MVWEAGFASVCEFLGESGLPGVAGARTVFVGSRQRPSMGLNEPGGSTPGEDQEIVCKDCGPHGCDVVFPSLVVAAEQSQHSLQE